MRTNFSIIAPLYPVDSTAARVTGRGEHWKSRKKASPSEIRNENVLRTMPFPAGAKPEHNITGLKVGRLTVLGLAVEQPRQGSSTGASWVVRCACGAYEHRKAKALKSPAYARRAMCSQCDNLEEIKAGRHPEYLVARS